MSLTDDGLVHKISDRAVLTGIKTEFNRTLPYWRCFTDLRQRFLHSPVVIDRDTRITCRLPCTVFKGVDVVWAVTTVSLNVQTGHPRKALASSNSGTSWSEPPTSTTLSAAASSNAGTTRRKRDADAMLMSQEPASATPPSRIPAEKKKLSRYWRTVPHETYVYHIGTMHFVHDDAHVRGSVGAARSFHVQSVVLYESPAVLQCVAGTMVVFAFLVYSSTALLHEGRLHLLNDQPRQSQEQEYREDDEAGSVARRSGAAAHTERPLVHAGLTRLGLPESGPTASDDPSAAADGPPAYRLHPKYQDPQKPPRAAILFPPATSRILILGMGGNSMAFALRHLLGPDADLHVVEVEPAVVKACQCAATLRTDDPHMIVHEKSADVALPLLDDGLFDMAFMDLFEPLKGSMENEDTLVAQVASKLKPGGLLVVNDHHLPTAKGLQPLVTRFGHGNVQAVNLHGWKESVIVCVQPGDPSKDGLGSLTSRWTMNAVFNVYEEFIPGWLPAPSWLQKSINVGEPSARARIWTS